MIRNASLRDTKLLLTTHLKRSQSIFLFDRQFDFVREIGRGSYSTVSGGPRERRACVGGRRGSAGGRWLS